MVVNLAPPAVTRILIADEQSIELARCERGVTLHVIEHAHDAAVALSPAQVSDLRVALGRLLDEAAIAQTASGRAIAEGIRQVFAALVELEKDAPAEAQRLYVAVVSHVRSAAPMALGVI